MARKKNSATKSEEKPVETKSAAAEKPKYGVPELAEALGIEAASVRVKLRKAGIEKSGRSYGWDTKSEMTDVVKQLKSAAAEESNEEPAPAPAKKGRGKKKAA